MKDSPLNKLPLTFVIAGLWSAIGFVGLIMGTGCFGPGGLSGHYFQTDCSSIYKALVILMSLPYLLERLVFGGMEGLDISVVLISSLIFSFILSFLLVNLVSFLKKKK